MSYEEIKIKMYEHGLNIICEQCEIDEFIPHGDGNKLMDILNEIWDLNFAKFTLTEKGKELLEKINSGEATWEDYNF